MTTHKITATGGAKSGKTQSLIDAANAHHAKGTKCEFLTHEDMTHVLRRRGLHPDIPVKRAKEEAVVVVLPGQVA